MVTHSSCLFGKKTPGGHQSEKIKDKTTSSLVERAAHHFEITSFLFFFLNVKLSFLFWNYHDIYWKRMFKMIWQNINNWQSHLLCSLKFILLENPKIWKSIKDWLQWKKNRFKYFYSKTHPQNFCQRAFAKKLARKKTFLVCLDIRNSLWSFKNSCTHFW
jgi:hypothetical protein